MKAEAVRYKPVQLDQEKLARLKSLLGTPSEAEALELAVDMLLAEEDIKDTLRKVRGKGRIERVFG
ncbi:MAG: hypothetical protein ACRERD_17715 [Candidatus Binatia bacterium]